MNLKSPLADISIVFVAALVVTVSFLGCGKQSGHGEVKMTGKLSRKTSDVEKHFRELSVLWKRKDAVFCAPEVKLSGEELKSLNEIHAGFMALAADAKDLKGDTPEETAALPHLVASIEASAKVPGIFFMRNVNPALVQPETMEQAKADGNKANAEWKQWDMMTRTLERQVSPPPREEPELPKPPGPPPGPK